MRLNGLTREQIINAVVENATKDRIESLRKRETALADEVYFHFVGPYKKEIETLPQDWFLKSDSIKLFIHSDSDDKSQTAIHMMDDEGRYDYQLKMSKSRVMPHAVAKNGCHLMHKGTIATTAMRLMKEHKELWGQVKTLRQEVRSFLQGHTSTATLIKKWPEVEKFLPEKKEPAGPQVSGEVLNKRINEIAAASY